MEDPGIGWIGFRYVDLGLAANKAGQRGVGDLESGVWS